jgi:hypothetical protein
MGEHQPQSALFFRKPGEDLARAHDLKMAIREAWADVKGNVESVTQKIAKSNCRFSSAYLVDFLESDKRLKLGSFEQDNFKSDKVFEGPISKEVLNGNFKRPAPKGKS